VGIANSACYILTIQFREIFYPFDILEVVILEFDIFEVNILEIDILEFNILEVDTLEVDVLEVDIVRRHPCQKTSDWREI
jgi:hypothetical protein